MSEVNHSLHLHEFKICLFYLEIQLMYAKLSRKLDLNRELLQKLGIHCLRRLPGFEPKNSTVTV